MIDKDLYQEIERLKVLSKGKITTIPLPSDELIDQYEQELGIDFGEDYRFFAKVASNVIYGTKDPLVFSTDKTVRGEFKAALGEARSLGLPNDWIPICEDNGDYFCLLPDKSIRYFSQDGPSEESWPSLAAWIREVWIPDV